MQALTTAVGSSSDPIKGVLNDLIEELQPVAISDDSVTEGDSLIHTVTWGATCGNGGNNPCVPPVDVLLTFDQEDVTTSVNNDYNGTPALSGGGNEVKWISIGSGRHDLFHDHLYDLR